MIVSDIPTICDVSVLKNCSPPDKVVTVALEVVLSTCAARVKLRGLRTSEDAADSSTLAVAEQPYQSSSVLCRAAHGHACTGGSKSMSGMHGKAS